MGSLGTIVFASSLVSLAQTSSDASAPDGTSAELSPRQEAAAGKVARHGGQRVLGGHHFIPSRIVDWAFPTTHFVFGVGLGYASGEIPFADGAGGIDTTELDVAAFSNALEFQFRVVDFLAIRLNAAGQALGGTNEDAALNFGATFDVSLGGGVTASFELGDRFQVGAVLDVRAGPAYNLNVINAVNRSLETGTITLGNGLTQGTNVSISSGAVAAVALHEAVGLFARLGYLHAIDTFGDTTEDQGSFAGGGGLSVDLDAVTPAPVGFVVAYSGLVPIDGPPTSHAGSVGLFYTGRANLALGLEAALFVDPFVVDRDITTYQGLFSIQYFW